MRQKEAAGLRFSFTGVLIGAKAGTLGLSSYLALVGFTILVGVVLIALSTMLTILSGPSTRSYAAIFARNGASQEL